MDQMGFFRPSQWPFKGDRLKKEKVGFHHIAVLIVKEWPFLHIECSPLNWKKKLRMKRDTIFFLLADVSSFSSSYVKGGGK